MLAIISIILTVDCILWGEWSTCYSSEHCGIGWKNRTRKASQPSFCESNAPLAEYKMCHNPCSSFHLQGMILIALLSLPFYTYHWSSCTDHCYKCCFANSLSSAILSVYLDWTKILYVKVISRYLSICTVIVVNLTGITEDHFTVSMSM